MDSELLAAVIPYVIAAGAIVVLVLDTLRRYIVFNSGLTPVIALIGGILAVALIMAMNAEPLTFQTGATAVLAGLISGFEAILIKDNGRAADDKQLLMRAGTDTKHAQVEQVIVPKPVDDATLHNH